MNHLLKIFEMLGDLYVVSAEQFPQKEAIWMELAGDEKKHLDWLRQLLDSCEKGQVVFAEDKIKTYTLEAFLSYIAGIVTKAENGELTLAQTMTMACDLENSLVIRKVFEHFDAPTSELKAIITRMNSEADQHHRRVLATMHPAA
jgi:rubrerythrin